MQIFTNPNELRETCHQWRQADDSIALVPTMGYYHKGHESLMEYGRQNAAKLVVSLFVNPSQFGPGEDLEAYPRDFERDASIAKSHGADALFCPTPEDMYGPGYGTWVEVPQMAKGLCGASRPIHFRGVCTVVMKLLQIVQPNIAIFGQKDWQQQAIIKRMVQDLNVPVKIIALPTGREEDGLALSSRNVYLMPQERAQAPQIRRGLLHAQELVRNGETSAQVLRQAVLDMWKESLPLGELDYLSIVHPETLEQVDTVTGPALMACAVRLGKARLIDNILLAD